MRASQVGIHSSLEDITAARKQADSLNLKISMITGDFPVPLNNDEGPDGLRNITPYLDLTELLGSEFNSDRHEGRGGYCLGTTCI